MELGPTCKLRIVIDKVVHSVHGRWFIEPFFKSIFVLPHLLSLAMSLQDV